ncbi:hypothetical protein M885DRAFT_538679 [Pelagophyceae sp. CCMP2097]|nr:hypothetical protein M885DRAFT_538679 [Pelagophyceae sp. CCMP2097]
MWTVAFLLASRFSAVAQRPPRPPARQPHRPAARQPAVRRPAAQPPARPAAAPPPRHAIISEAVVTDKLPYKDAARYFSVVQVPRGFSDGEDEVWTFARTGDWPSSADHSVTLIWTNGTADKVTTEPRRVVVGDFNVGHNFGPLFVDGTFLGAGGEWHGKPRVPASLDAQRITEHGLPDGIHFVQAADRASAVGGYGAGWCDLAALRLTGNHTGCIEKRSKDYLSVRGRMHCEFDGRVSLVHFKGELYAYVRANVHPQAGGRYVQFVKRSLAPAGAWSNFQMISIQNYPMAKAAANDLYFPAMNVNPADESTLLVLFPAALLNKATIALSFSCDGHHFSTMELFVPSRPAFGHRTADQPVDGIIVRGTDAFFYVHNDVPGLLPTKQGMGTPTPSRLTRYTVPLASLKEHTQKAKAELAKAGWCPS